MKIIASLANFKGSLSNAQASFIVAETLKPAHEPLIFPIADGGRGTLAAWASALGGECNEELGILGYPTLASPSEIVVESAATCGVPAMAQDALLASSHLLGQQLANIFREKGKTLRRLFIGLGDTLSSDAGIGMLCGLGYRFFDRQGRALEGNAANLRKVASISLPKIQIPDEPKIFALCDVNNPLCGPDGSARVFSPQKGASPEQVSQIEEGMEHFAEVIQRETGKRVSDLPGGGAAGGLGAALFGFLSAELLPGAKSLLDRVDYDKALKNCDVVITGEGRTDAQTVSGKAPWECLQRAKRLEKKVIFLCGSFGLGSEWIRNDRTILKFIEVGRNPTPEEALKRATKALF